MPRPWGVQVGTEPGDGPAVIAVGFRCLFNRLFVVVPVIVSVVVRMVLGGGSALTGRVGRHSTAGLAVVAAASLAFAQLDEGIGRSHPQLGREGGVVGGPVGEQGPWTWFRPGFLTGLWHTANITTNAALAPVSPARGRESAPEFPVSRPAREFMPGPGNGCVTALRERTARSTSPSACPLSPLVRSTGMTDHGLRSRAVKRRWPAHAGALTTNGVTNWAGSYGRSASRTTRTTRACSRMVSVPSEPGWRPNPQYMATPKSVM
jgi:hypothetical protein